MEHHTNPKISSTIFYYIDNIDDKQLKETKEKQLRLVKSIFYGECGNEVLTEENKQLILDAVFLSWLQFYRKSVEMNWEAFDEYKKLLEEINYMRNLWYSAMSRKQFESTGKSVVITKTRLIDDFSCKLMTLPPEEEITTAVDMIGFTSYILSNDYDKVVDTLARYDL